MMRLSIILLLTFLSGCATITNKFKNYDDFTNQELASMGHSVKKNENAASTVKPISPIVIVKDDPIKKNENEKIPHIEIANAKKDGTSPSLLLTENITPDETMTSPKQQRKSFDWVFDKSISLEGMFAHITQDDNDTQGLHIIRMIDQDETGNFVAHAKIKNEGSKKSYYNIDDFVLTVTTVNEDEHQFLRLSYEYLDKNKHHRKSLMIDKEIISSHVYHLHDKIFVKLIK
jgi:hypothetical protein